MLFFFHFWASYGLMDFKSVSLYFTLPNTMPKLLQIWPVGACLGPFDMTFWHLFLKDPLLSRTKSYFRLSLSHLFDSPCSITCSDKVSVIFQEVLVPVSGKEYYRLKLKKMGIPSALWPPLTTPWLEGGKVIIL